MSTVIAKMEGNSSVRTKPFVIRGRSTLLPIWAKLCAEGRRAMKNGAEQRATNPIVVSFEHPNWYRRIPNKKVTIKLKRTAMTNRKRFCMMKSVNLRSFFSPRKIFVVVTKEHINKNMYSERKDSTLQKPPLCSKMQAKQPASHNRMTTMEYITPLRPWQQ